MRSPRDRKPFFERLKTGLAECEKVAKRASDPGNLGDRADRAGRSHQLACVLAASGGAGDYREQFHRDAK